MIRAVMNGIAPEPGCSVSFSTSTRANELMSTENLLNHDFLFDDFVLNANGTLSFHGQDVAIPPKELHVLITLLEGKGNLVHKNFIIDQVWGETLVGDESLTRCIYSLRRLLRESKNNKYIETVYGKGYRFCKTVTLVPRQRPVAQHYKLAVLPFRGIDPAEADRLHAGLLDAITRERHPRLSVVPAMLTRGQDRLDDVLSLCERLGLDCYLSGEFRQERGERLLLLELVDAADQNLIGRETLRLNDAESWDERLAGFAATLPVRLPIGGIEDAVGSSSEVLLSHMMARRCLRRRETGDLSLARQYLQMGLMQDPHHVPSLTSQAETSLAMAMQGEIWPERAFGEAREALEKAMAIAPDYPSTLGVLGWLTCLSGENHLVASSMFRHAAQQPGAAAELYLYSAMQLCMQGQFEQSHQQLSICLARDAELAPAQMFKLWLFDLMGRQEEAIGIALAQDPAIQHTPGFYSVLAMVLVHAGQIAQARRYAGLALEQGRATQPERIMHAIVQCFTDAAAAREALLRWRGEAHARYRCPGLLALLALQLDDVGLVRELAALARAQHCVWWPLVRVAPRMAAFLSHQQEERCA